MTGNIESLEKAIIKISPKCNNKCLFCHENEFEYDTLSPEAILQKTSMAVDLGAQMLIFSGGEPSIHPEFKKITSMIKKTFNIPFGLVTNGRMLSSEGFFSKLIENGLCYIYLSISGHRSKLHDRVTRVAGAFKQSDAAIDNIIIHFPHENPLMINVVVNRFNFPYLKRIAEYLLQKQIINIKFSLCEIKGSAIQNTEILVDPVQLANHLEQVYEYTSERGMQMYYDGLPDCFFNNLEITKRQHNFFSDKIMWISEGNEPDFYETTLSDREYFDTCKRCSRNNECHGIYNGYNSLFMIDKYVKPTVTV